MNTNSPINDKTNMYVSGLLHRGEAGKDLSVCIMLEEADKSVEIRMPGEEILSHKGYTPNEIKEILVYLRENLDDIMKTAKEINPMKAFMS